MKHYPVAEVSDMLSEGIIDNFTWCFSDKEEAEKFRKNLNMSLSRRELNNKFGVSVFAAVKNDLQSIAHLVLVEPKK